jgi:hypothetical protein
VAIEDGRIVRELAVERQADVGLAARNLLRAVARRVLPAEPRRTLPAPAPRRVPVPIDPALPRLPVVLDPDAVAPFLRRSLGRDAPEPDVRVRYLRYRPGTKAVVHYEVGLDGRLHDAVAMIAAGRSLARRAEKPENLALARLVNGRSPAAMPLHYEPDLNALLQWYPLDLDLPALAEPPGRLRAELQAAGVTLDEADRGPITLRYKPRRRAVLRLGEHVLKVYSREEDFAAAAAALRAAGSIRGLRTPSLEAHLPARCVTVQPLVAGSSPDRPAAVATGAGELLRELQSEASARLVAATLFALPDDEDPDGPTGLHAARTAVLTAAPPARQLAIAEASARFVAAILPALGGRLEALVRDLEASMPLIDRLVLAHGDFSARQLLVTADGLAVVDFDAMCLAPAALDPATYAAHLVSGGPDDLAAALGALEALVDGYGGRPPGLSWYLATSILRHSRYPFRYLEEQWPERIEGMVAAAENALAAR